MYGENTLAILRTPYAFFLLRYVHVAVLLEDMLHILAGIE
jgi:hypothetical protein